MEYKLARALLLSTALGDALGLPLEISEVSPRSTWLEDISNIKPIVYNDEIIYSDDTETMMILGETIIESCGFNPQRFIEHLVHKARTWDPIRNYNEGLAEVIEAVRKGHDWRIAARLVWGGQGNFSNNAAVRSPPIIIFYETRHAVEAMSVAQAMVTHVHPLSLESTRLYAIALYEVAKGIDIASIPSLLARETMNEEIREKLELIEELGDAPPDRVARVLGNGSAAHESLAAALYAVIRADGNPRKAILYALSLGGDADGITAMAAALAALASPNEFLDDTVLSRMYRNLERVEDLEHIASRLVKIRSLCTSTLL